MNTTRTNRPIRSVYRLSAIAAIVVVGTLGAAGAAHATYPGSTNGRLGFGATVAGNTDVYSALPNGRGLQRLTSQPGFDACPASSADGKWIAYCSGVAPIFEIWVMRQDGTEKRQLTTLGGSATFPDFSPDAGRIAFTAATAQTADTDILAMNSDGSSVVALTSSAGDDRYPAYSPDGTKIVFLSARTGQPQVWLMNADGSNQTQLTFDPVMKDQVPDWSPDGSQIAFVTRLDPSVPGGDLWLMDADGGNQRNITGGPEPEYGASWSPDGTAIAYLDWATRRVNILDLVTGERRVVNDFAPQFVPGWQPRGDRLP
jgi:Tol biopolymer transport system component